MSFDVNALLTSIPVPVVPDVIHREFIEIICQTGMETFLENTSFMPWDSVNSLLELVLNNCIFSFQGKL